MPDIKLVKVVKSPKKGKKYRAHFKKDGKEVYTDFGATGYADYTVHKDTDRRDRYISRHKKDLQTNNPTKAGYLSMFILWNKKGFKASVADYRKRLSKYNSTGYFPKKI